MPTTTSQDGTTITYDVRGEGPPLVYVTGASCSRRFGPVVSDAKAFARVCTVVTYDRRGRGDSGDCAPWTLEREVEDLEAVIDAVGGRARVYGHSSGAVLALHAARRLPDKVESVLAYDASWVHDEEERVEYAALSARVLRLLDAGSHAGAMRTFLRGIGMPSPFVTLLPLFPGWRTMRDLAPTLRYDIALTADLPPVQEMAEIRVPTHVAVGERSPASLHAVADMLAEAIPGSTLCVVPRQDHMVSARAVLPLLTDRLGVADALPHR